MIIYQVFGKIPYDTSHSLFTTSSKELAEEFKKRVEKYSSYVNKKMSIYFELEDKIQEKVHKNFCIDYSKATQEDLQKINSEIDLEYDEFLKLLNESPVEQRSYRHLNSAYLDYESFEVVELNLADTLPELFSFKEDVIEDEIEFLKKEFEEF